MNKKTVKSDVKPRFCQNCGKPMPPDWYCFIDKWICRECCNRI